MKYLFLLLTFVLLVGCLSKEYFTRNYQHSNVYLQSDKWLGYNVKEGSMSVLQNHFTISSLPFVVDGISGYNLLLELNDQEIIEGKEILIPTEKGKAYLHILHAPSYKNIEDVKGIKKHCRAMELCVA